MFPSVPFLKPIGADSPVHDCAPDAGSPDGEFELEQYGPFKVGSERAVDQHFAGRSAHLRAGLIIGPYDDTNRFPYWVDRMARGGEVLAPGGPDRPMRLVDARDLGAWAVEVARNRVTGAYVATGPAGQVTSAAERAGLRTRPIADSARDTLAWLRAGGNDKPANPRTGRAGLDPDREKELLAAWHERGQG